MDFVGSFFETRLITVEKDDSKDFYFSILNDINVCHLFFCVSIYYSFLIVLVFFHIFFVAYSLFSSSVLSSCVYRLLPYDRTTTGISTPYFHWTMISWATSTICRTWTWKRIGPMHTIICRRQRQLAPSPMIMICLAWNRTPTICLAHRSNWFPAHSRTTVDFPAIILTCTCTIQCTLYFC